MKHNEDYICPHCGEEESVRSVSGLVNAGTERAIGVMPVHVDHGGPRVNSDGNGVVPNYGGTAYRPMGWIEKSALASQLSCPARKRTKGWNIFWLIILTVFLCYIASASALFLVALAFGIYLIWRANKKNSVKQAEYDAIHKEQREVWGQLLYCERCNSVFLPGFNTYGPAERMYGYIDNTVKEMTGRRVY